ncbi:MAG: DUF2225 domain-containing protein [Lachnospiraceae bacterium]|nr:DUF2225 domain-containing protein [Lachnospiraceae bacterium]
MAGSSADKLFDKKYTCPICENNFTAKTVRSGKTRMIRTDMDLRNVYEDIEPLKYDVILCPKCGYAALARFFPNVTNIQQKYISEKITPNFKPLQDDGDDYTYEQALTRYKIAFANAVVKMAKFSEGAYLSLKTAWIYRSYKESLDREMAGYETKYEKLEISEKENLRKAYDYFVKAVQTEEFPMCGMDEPTVDYIIAVLAMEFGDYFDSSKLLSKLITSYSASGRLKDRARDVKEELARRMKEAGVDSE